MLHLRASELTWINGQADDPTDRCAHGKVELSLDGESIYTTGDGDITVSAACLYLLRTIEDDHTEERSVAQGNWLFPCCGFSLLPDNGRYDLCCMGCKTGTDVFVRHLGSDLILTTGGRSFRTTTMEWTVAVLALVEQVERFYASCTPKAEGADELELKGWRLFWSEWEGRKARAVQSVA